jgi:hypothetical protein
LFDFVGCDPVAREERGERVVKARCDHTIDV